MRRAVPATRRAAALRPGDRVRLVLPAGPASAPRLARAAGRVRTLGFDPVVPAHRAGRGYLAGDDATRATELAEALADVRARAVLAVRGGTGSMRLLADVDRLALRGHAPLLVGFSDVTALHAVLYVRHRLVGLQGPMPGLSGWDAASARSLRRALTSDEPLGPLTGRPVRWKVLARGRTGRARGVLLGGNLAMVAALVGTPWQLPAAGAILYLEDVDESPHRIERMLLTMRYAGGLDEAAGIVFGTLTRCRPTGRNPSLTTREVLGDVLGGMRVPVVVGFPAGHAWPMVTVPLGVRAALDAGRGLLAATEPALARRRD